MNFFSYVFQDWNRNKRNRKGQFVTALFRLAACINNNIFSRVIFFPYLIFYRFFVEWVLGIELPWRTKVGPGLVIWHGQSTILNRDVVIGENCTIRHSTTIGEAKYNGGSPVIGNNVDIGANVCIVGEISIGDNVIISIGSVVIKSVPSNSLVGGNPAKYIAN